MISCTSILILTCTYLKISMVSVTCIRFSCLLNCTNDWYVNIDRGKFTVMIFIDLKKDFDTVNHQILLNKMRNRPFSYSGKESKSNDVMIQFVEFSNVHNSDRTSNATRSNLAYKIV